MVGSGPIKVEGTKLIFSKKATSPTGDGSGLVLRIKKGDVNFPLKSSRKRKYVDDSDEELMSLTNETPRTSMAENSTQNTANIITGARSRIRKGGAGAEVELGNVLEKILNHIKTLPVVR